MEAHFDANVEYWSFPSHPIETIVIGFISPLGTLKFKYNDSEG
jgi:hypothetical protein